MFSSVPSFIRSRRATHLIHPPCQRVMRHDFQLLKIVTAGWISMEVICYLCALGCGRLASIGLRSGLITPTESKKFYNRVTMDACARRPHGKTVGGPNQRGEKEREEINIFASNLRRAQASNLQPHAPRE